jgi:hypothetical protein
VTRRAKGLPVSWKPKEGFVATVRNNVIDECRGLAATLAMRMRLEILVAGLAPTVIIAAFTCGGSALVKACLTGALLLLAVLAKRASVEDLPATARA